MLIAKFEVSVDGTVEHAGLRGDEADPEVLWHCDEALCRVGLGSGLDVHCAVSVRVRIRVREPCMR